MCNFSRVACSRLLPGIHWLGDDEAGINLSVCNLVGGVLSVSKVSNICDSDGKMWGALHPAIPVSASPTH